MMSSLLHCGDLAGSEQGLYKTWNKMHRQRHLSIYGILFLSSHTQSFRNGIKKEKSVRTQSSKRPFVKLVVFYF